MRRFVTVCTNISLPSSASSTPKGVITGLIWVTYLGYFQRLERFLNRLSHLLLGPTPRPPRDLRADDRPFLEVRLAQQRLASTRRVGRVCARCVKFCVAVLAEDVEERLCFGRGGVFGNLVWGLVKGEGVALR